MSDTPRTDAAINAPRNERGVYDELDRMTALARTLERDLREAKVSADRWCAKWRDETDALRRENASLRCLLASSKPVLEEHQDTATGQSEYLRNLIVAISNAIE